MTPEEAQPIVVTMGRFLQAKHGGDIEIDIGEIGSDKDGPVHLVLRLNRTSAKHVLAQIVTAAATVFFRRQNS